MAILPTGDRGGIGINYQGTSYEFAKNQYRIYHSSWVYDWKNRSFYPGETLVIAWNEKDLLRVKIEAIQTEGLTNEVLRLIPQVIIYEQTAFIEGKLWELSVPGGLSEVFSFSGSGFNEYTAVKYLHLDCPFLSRKGD